jgi:sugar phosphate isomerase/epimerase
MSTRRDVLKGILAAGAMPAASARGATLNEIGLQLYTVRDSLTADFAGTLREVARLGYHEVEFAGHLGPGAKQARELLTQVGLRAPSMHVEYESLRGNLQAALETAKTLGAGFVVCPWLDPAQHPAEEDWKRVSEALNSIGERAARAGLTFAYHNHDFELRPLPQGSRPLDVLLAHTDEKLVTFELDVYWATKAGSDPVSYLRTHQRRFPLFHLKDMASDGSFTEVGSGTIDFAAIIRAAMDGAYFFVEQDVSADPMRSIAASIAHLKQLR